MCLRVGTYVFALHSAVLFPSVFPTVPALGAECCRRHVYPIARLAGCPLNEKDGLPNIGADGNTTNSNQIYNYNHSN